MIQMLSDTDAIERLKIQFGTSLVIQVHLWDVMYQQYQIIKLIELLQFRQEE